MFKVEITGATLPEFYANAVNLTILLARGGNAMNAE